jgi:hypothetical protein
MRRKQFLQLIYELRAEIGKAVDPAVGVSDLPSLKQTIARNYESLYDDYDWPHLSVISARIPLSAGQRYYDFPADMGYEGVTEAVVWWNGDPLPLTRGISFDQYAEYDSDSDERSDPAVCWDVRYTGTREQCELWPVPASNGSVKLQFRGKRKFIPLVDDADLCLIDDHLVVLTSAVELLPRQKSGDAQVKLAALQSRYSRLKGRSKGASKSVRVGLGASPQESGRPTRSIVRVGR